MTAFAQWTDRFFEATGAQKAGLLSEGVKLAEQRRLVLAQFIRSDPERALAAAVPLTVRTQLPDEIVPLLEERVSGRGDLPLIGVIPAPGQKVDAALARLAVINQRTYRAYSYGRRAKLATITEASITGIALDEALAVSDSPLRVLEKGEVAAGRLVEEVCVISGKVTPVDSDSPLNITAPTAVEANGHIQMLCEPAHVALYEDKLAAKEAINVEKLAADGQSGSSGVSGRPTQAWTHGTKKVLIIRVDFSDLPGPSVTEDEVVNLFNDANGVRDYFQQGSFGKTSLQIAPAINGDSPDVTGVLRMSRSAADYATNGISTYGDTLVLHDDARTAAQAAGFSTNAYDRIGVTFPNLSQLAGSKVAYAGYGYVIDDRFAINGSFSFRVVTHEIGHNYGLWHARLWQVSDGNPVSDTGTSVDYGDSFDIMGSGGGFENHFTHWNKSILQWIPDTAIPTVTNSGIYRIFRFDHQNANLSNILAIKIVRDGTRDYWIGYRRGTSNVNLNNGAYILWGYNYNQGGDLLDMVTPGNDTQDAALAISATFIDPVANVAIHPIAQGGVVPNEYLDLQVTFGQVLPVITAHPQDQITTPGQGVALIVQASGIPVPNYQWQRQVSGTVTWLNLIDGSDYSGSGTSTLLVNGTRLLMHGDQFRCVVSNSSGSVTSSPPAVLTVIPFGVTIFAGQAGWSGHTDGVGNIAKFSVPRGVAVDTSGNIFVADTGNHTIRKITPVGAVNTLAGLAGSLGSADGTSSDARFYLPHGIAADNTGNLYVADTDNHTIRKITPDGVVNTLAGLAGNSGSANGTASAARFCFPKGIAVDTSGNVYVADEANHTIRKITAGGVVNTLAGLAGSSGSADGDTNSARFYFPDGVAVDKSGNVYVADTGNQTIRKITPAGVVSTLAGLVGSRGSTDGVGSNAQFN
ncbi:MAG: immunoglobulin domain-containing protein, partial [Fimbriimonadaceae bacterium]